MVSAVQIEQVSQELAGVFCSQPFDYLGLHPHNSGKGLVIRVWRPDARRIRVVDALTRKTLGNMQQLTSGLFELHLPRRRNTFNYLLKIQQLSGHSFELFDPYQFGEYVLKQEDIEPNRQYCHLGARLQSHPLNNRQQVTGVLFKVYAPNAGSVSVVGDFNQWDGRLHPMASADDGVWRLFVPNLQPGDLYKYELKGPGGELLPVKADPYGFYAEQAPGNASIIYDHNKYRWRDKNWRYNLPDYLKRPLAIYEVHLGSWRHKEGQRPLSYRELANQLVPYVKKLGFTHIELMPITEYPFDGSWGYQPVGLFAPTSRYGSPDDFKYLIDRCHQAGIGVILDWVAAHFPSDGHGLAQFDGSPLYEHHDPQRGWHPDWHSYIYDYGKPEVRQFLISNALYWLDYFHLDGLRIDAVASMLYLDYSREPGQWQPNQFGGNSNLDAVDFLKQLNETLYLHFPDRMTIAEESTSWSKVSKPTYDGGLGFGFKWNMGWMNDSLAYMGHDPVHRQHHHHEFTFSMIYAYHEHFILALSHDEVVHGKGSLLARMPGDHWQRCANLRAYYGFMYGHPGKKLLFMGSELASYQEWNYQQSLDWHLVKDDRPDNYHLGIQRLIADLNQLYRQWPALYQQDYSAGGFSWLVVDDHQQSVFAFVRYDDSGQQPIIVISNLTPLVRHHYRLGVPRAGCYQEALNTDNPKYGGSGVANPPCSSEPQPLHQQQQSMVLDLPPLATLMLVLKD